MIESELHPCGAIAFAEARGQTGPEVFEEIVLKKFEVVNELLAKHSDSQNEADLPKEALVSGKLIFNPGTCSI